MKSFFAAFFFAIFAACGFSSSAQDENFKWSMRHAAGGKIEVSVEIPHNYYLYADVTKAIVSSADGKALRILVSPSAARHTDELAQEYLAFDPGLHKWIFDAAGSKGPYLAKVRYQGCSKSPFMCYPPNELEIRLGGDISDNMADALGRVGGKLSVLKPPAVAPTEKTQDLGLLAGDLYARGGWWIFLAAFLGGVLSCLTPCVLPLIPITIAILSKDKGEGGSSLVESFFYALGIAVTFTVLAAIAAFGGKAFGSQLLGNRTFLLILASLFFLLSLSMLGLYDLRLPSSLQTKLASVKGGGSFGAFAMGLAAGLIAVPCTGPVLAALLGVAAASANPVFSVFLLFSYACGFGLPFIFVAAGANILPARNGPLMEAVKSILGLAIMILGFYGLVMAVPAFSSFIRESSPYSRHLSLLCVILGFLMGAVHIRSASSPNLASKTAKIAGALTLAFGIVWNLSQAPSSPDAGDNRYIKWLEYDDAVLAEAAASKKMVLLDFGAEWCAACKQMDITTLQDKAVADEILSHWTAVKVDCTINTRETQDLLEKFSVRGFPTYVILSRQGVVLDVFTGYRSADEFLSLLRAAREKSK